MDPPSLESAGDLYSSSPVIYGSLVVSEEKKEDKDEAKNSLQSELYYSSSTNVKSGEDRDSPPEVKLFSGMLDPGSIRSAVFLPGALPESGKHNFVKKSTTYSTDILRDSSNVQQYPRHAFSQKLFNDSQISLMKEHCLCCTPWSPVSGVLCATRHELTFEPDPRSQLVRDHGIGALQIYVDIDDILACALLMLPDGPLLKSYFGFGSNYTTYEDILHATSVPMTQNIRDANCRSDVPTFFQIIVRSTTNIHPRSLRINEYMKSSKMDDSSKQEEDMEGEKQENSGKKNEEDNRSPSLNKGFVSRVPRAQSLPSLPSMMQWKYPSSSSSKMDRDKNENRKMLDKIKLSRSLFEAVMHPRRLLFVMSPFKSKKKKSVLPECWDTLGGGKSGESDVSVLLSQDPCGILSSMSQASILKRYKSEPASLNAVDLCREIQRGRQDDIKGVSLDEKKMEDVQNLLSNPKSRSTLVHNTEENCISVVFRIFNQVAGRQLTSFTMDSIDARRNDSRLGNDVTGDTLLEEKQQSDANDNADNVEEMATAVASSNRTRSLTSLAFHSNDVLEAFLLSCDAQERLLQYATERFRLKAHEDQIYSPVSLAFRELKIWKSFDQAKEEKQESINIIQPVTESLELSPVHLNAPRIEKLPQHSVALVTEEVASSLAKYLPPRLLLRVWKLGYCTKCHGVSFSTFFHRLAGVGPCLFLIRDTNGTLFGAFCSVPIRESFHYYGTGECFVFTFKSNNKPKTDTAIENTVSVYFWTRKNAYFVFSDTKTIAFGGGGGYAITVDSNFLRGSSSPCLTYNNPCLSTSADFLIHNFQVWYFGD